jgi:uncharacterized protein YrzB (UPF0473 family)
MISKSDKDLEVTQDVEEEAEVVVFVDENDKEYEFEIIDEMIVDDVKYIALVATEESEDFEADDQQSDELVIVKSVFENGEEALILLDDEEEFERISALFTERLSAFFDMNDCDECDCDCASCDGGCGDDD